MRFSLCRIVVIASLCTVKSQADPLAQGRLLEISGYFSMASYGDNVSLQSDITAGVNAFGFLNLSVGTTLGYRNYCINALSFLTISAGKAWAKNELRAGIVGGLYTLRVSGYQSAVPCAGGEVLYSFSITGNTSLRIKERVCNFYEDHHALISTSSFIGLCFAFAGVAASTK